MISLDKCNGSYNAVYDLSTKMCVPSKTKDLNVKIFNIICNNNNIWRWIIGKSISCDCTCKFNNVAQIKNKITKHVNVNAKSIVPAKKITIGILVHVFVRTVGI